MSVATLSTQLSTSALSITINTYTNLFTQASVTGTGNNVLITGYVQGLDASQTQTRILVDGTDVYDGTPDQQAQVVVNLSSGSHTIDYQVYSFITGQSAGGRALTVLNLT